MPTSTTPLPRPAIAALQPQLVQWRRHLHRFPELGFQERATHRFIVQKLTSWGIDVREVAKTGVVATVTGQAEGPVLAVRADMDALPILERNGVDYASETPGVMHACGHDGHVTIALGTAFLLAQHRERLPGTVKFLFQPAEEGPGGALPMIAEGALEAPTVEAMIGLHLWNSLPIGQLGVKAGPSMADTAQFKVTITGKGGHGALPHQTIDAIVVGAQVVSALQTIVARNIDPFEPAVVTVGKFHGGSNFNIIAQTVELEGTVRCFAPELAQVLPARIEQVIAGICQAHGATYELAYRRHYPSVINDERVAALVRSVAEEFLGPDQVRPETTLGGEDMAFFLQKVPGCYFFLGSANPELGLDKPHHHPCFDFDEGALGLGVELFVRCLERFWQQPLDR
ncbi:M20 metallopeptidase family protein [Gloeobacter kilaueensis]|uniref:Amidohydrolase n=1 Tax=Gloeobacter kilaueensis (strain ATCC BAA-2537 / CCAP 1431/1 / ULC 316 / JS1) TaxID=1183438 RepID=U5QEM5_GLOK1|nr:amidohydrolase [Gloeobacter kilaueensis]AGY57402.1 amidohydrolase [Gloeobacter kilaueensis JS1]